MMVSENEMKDKKIIKNEKRIYNPSQTKLTDKDFLLMEMFGVGWWIRNPEKREKQKTEKPSVFFIHLINF